MNLHIIGIIINREYLNRVKKKSFLVTTFIVPVLFAAICILPSVIMFATKEEAKKVAVVDRSGIVMNTLEDNATVAYVDGAEYEPDYLKANMEELGYDAVLFISPLDSASRSVNADIYSPKPMGIETDEIITNRINKAVETYRIESYGIDYDSAHEFDTYEGFDRKKELKKRSMLNEVEATRVQENFKAFSNFRKGNV